MLDAIVLLGCRIEAGGKPSPAARRRAERAAAAWHAGLAPLVVVSGGRRWHGVAEAEALGVELQRAGVSESAILREWRSLSTAENARYTAQLLAPRGARRVVIVTCDFHLPRALKSFRRAGLDTVGIGVPSPEMSTFRQLARHLRERVSGWIDGRLTWEK